MIMEARAKRRAGGARARQVCAAAGSYKGIAETLGESCRKAGLPYSKPS